MRNKMILPILSSVLITASFIALLLGQKEERKSSDAILSQDDFDDTINSSISTIDAIRLAEWIKNQKNFYWLIDLRSKDAFKEYHIPTSTNMNLEQILKSDIKINNRIYLIDVYEEKSIQAYYLLNIRGYYDVHVLRGGMSSWTSKILFPQRSSIDSTSFEMRQSLTDFFGGQIIDGNSTRDFKPKSDLQIEKANTSQIGC